MQKKGKWCWAGRLKVAFWRSEYEGTVWSFVIRANVHSISWCWVAGILQWRLSTVRAVCACVVWHVCVCVCGLCVCELCVVWCVCCVCVVCVLCVCVLCMCCVLCVLCGVLCVWGMFCVCVVWCVCVCMCVCSQHTVSDTASLHVVCSVSHYTSCIKTLSILYTP